MPDLPTWQALFRVGRDEILARSDRLTIEAIEREGSDVNALVAAAAAIGDEVVGQLATGLGGLFLDTAKGEALDRLVFDRYGMTRKAAAPAFGTVLFATTAATAAAFTIPAGTVLGTSDGLQFVTIAAVAFPAASVGPVVANVRSILAGADQQAKASTIKSIVTSITGQPADLTVNNSTATAGAADEEADDSLRARARAFFTTARRGTLGAIKLGALAVPGVETASVIELLDLDGQPDQIVSVVVADAFTDALVEDNANPPAYQAQSQALGVAIAAALEEVRAAGIPVRVAVAQVVMQPIHFAVAFVAGVDVDTVTTSAKATAC